MISSSAKQGRSPRCQSAIILRLLGGQKVQILSPPSRDNKKNLTSLFRFRSVLPLPHTPEVNTTARRNRMGQQKQTKLPKNTHYFLLFPTFLPFRKKTASFSVSFDIDSSIIRAPNLSLHSETSSTRNQAVLSPPTSLAVWDQNSICLSFFEP